MAAKIEFTAKITTDEGEKEVTFTSARDIPDFSDFESLGFMSAFDTLEDAVLNARKEVSEKVVAQFLSDGSKKNGT